MKLGVSNTIPNITNLPGQGGGGAFSTKSLLFNPALDWVQSYPVYSALDGLDNFAVSFWIKFDDLTSNKNIFGISNQPLAGGDLRDQQIQCAWNSTGNWLQIYFNDITTYCYTDPLIWTPVTGTWYHVLITRDTTRVGDKCKVYVDGDDCLNGETGTQPTLNTSTSGIYIGDSDGLLNSSITGNIDEFAIYTQDMAAYKDEIYNGGTPDDLDNLPTAPSPNVWYRMGENATFKDPQILMPENTNKDKVSNYSFAFDGTGDFISIYDGASGSGPIQFNAADDFSISAWIKTTNAGATNQIVSFRGTAIIWFSTFKTGANIRLKVYLRDNSNNVYSLDSYNSAAGWIASDTWTHVMFTRNGTSKVVKLYINGAPAQVTGTDTTSDNFTSYDKLSLANDNYAGGRYWFDGNMDEVAIFSSDQSGNAATIYNSGTPTDLTSLSPTSWWRMGEQATFSTIWTVPDQIGSNDGVSANMDIYARTGDAPDSPNNALSYNMDAAAIVEDTPPNP